MNVLDILVQAALLGGLYALFALGQSVVFGVMRLTNIAHGDFVVLASFGAIGGATMLAAHPVLASLLLLPVAFGLGYTLQRLLLNRTVGHDPLPSLVVTFGLSIVIQNALLALFSADPRAIEAPDLVASSLHLGVVDVGWVPLAILLLALVCTAALQALFDHTDLGRAFRAVSDDKEVAELMGLDARKVFAAATGIAFVVVALAGILQSVRTTVSPTDGPVLLLSAFEAVIVGGLGSMWGTFVGAMVLGLAQQLGFRVDPGWGIWFGHLVFLAILAVRPQGLFPATRN